MILLMFKGLSDSIKVLNMSLNIPTTLSLYL
nr:MAG TPA: hypothetical protein [Crassvirales sp.]